MRNALPARFPGSWQHRLYRLYVRYRGEHFEAVAGRQRIPWGVGILWSPLDRFNFIPPLAVESDQTAGVDAVLARWLPTDFTSLEVVAAPQKRWEESAYAVRWHGVARDTDYSLVAGIFRDAPAGGLDAARNLAAAVVRVEAVYAQPRRATWPIGLPAPRTLPGFWQVVVSADRNLAVGNGLYVLVEYLYNGNALGFGRGMAGPLLGWFEATELPPAPLGASGGDLAGPFATPASPRILGGSQVVTFGAHQSGVQFAYEFGPALRADLFALADWEGPSTAVAPAARWAPYGFLEITAGVQMFAGPRRSEYGRGEPLGFLLFETFF